MSTYTQILYQIVFSTKHRKRTLIKQDRERLFKYITGLLKEKRCFAYQVNGVEDHIHIVTDIHPMVAPALLVKDIKLSTSYLIKREGLFPDFGGWQNGYGAFTYAPSAKYNLIKYVKNQEEHHRHKSSKTELIELLEEHEIVYDERYLE